MRRRLISVGSVLLVVGALLVVLANATLVDRRAPTVTGVSLTAPVEGQASLALTLSAVEIRFSEPVRTPTVERHFRIEPYIAGAITWDGSTATFTPSPKLPPDTEFTVTVAPGFEDLAGNVATDGSPAFTFRTVGPPVVASVDPADGSIGVAVDADLAISFDRLMDTTAVEGAIRLEPPAAMRPSWSGRTLSLGFEEPLDFGRTYRLTVDADAADTDGSRLRAPFTTTFTTVEAGLRTASTIPRDGAAGIGVRTPIAVVFDGPIDPASVDGALTVTPAVRGDLRVVSLPADEVAPRPTGDQAGGVVLLLQPSDPLAAHTTYTVRLDPVVARLDSPAQVAPSRTWTFTTGQPTGSAHNHIAYLSDRSGSREVWLMNPDGSAPRQVTTGLAPVSGFDVTLDGSSIAFAAGGEVRTMAMDGDDEAVLTQGGRFEYAPRFSPDGRSLLVARREADGTDAGWWVVPLVAGTSGERQVLRSGAPPLGSTELEGEGIDGGDGMPSWLARAAWDPSGRWLLVTAADERVFLVDLEAAEPAAASIDTRVTAGAGGAWSPSDERFVIVGRAAGTTASGLYTIDTLGGAERQAAAIGSVAAADDGTVAYLVPGAVRASHVGLSHVGTDQPPARLTFDNRFADRWPTFAPDGRSVVFGRVLASDPTESAGIWMIPTDGGTAVALTTDGAYPRWLP